MVIVASANAEVQRKNSEVFASEQYQKNVQHLLTQKCSRKAVKCSQANSIKLIVQHRFHRSAAFAPQSAAVPAERAVLEARLPKLRKVFFKNLNL
jgi:hypothetical protein